MTYSDIIVTREMIKGYIGRTPLCMGWRHKYIGWLLKIVPFSAATAFVNRMFPMPQAARKKQKKINYFPPPFADIVSRMYPNYSCTHNKKKRLPITQTTSSHTIRTTLLAQVLSSLLNGNSPLLLADRHTQ